MASSKGFTFIAYHIKVKVTGGSVDILTLCILCRFHMYILEYIKLFYT